VITKWLSVRTLTKVWVDPNGVGLYPATGGYEPLEAGAVGVIEAVSYRYGSPLAQVVFPRGFRGTLAQSTWEVVGARVDTFLRLRGQYHKAILANDRVRMRESLNLMNGLISDLTDEERARITPANKPVCRCKSTPSNKELYEELRIDCVF
jgi:hypothetical protein